MLCSSSISISSYSLTSCIGCQHLSHFIKERRRADLVENKSHADNYVGTKSMKAENQNMEFVNDTLELAEDQDLILHEEKKKQQEK